MGELFLMPLRTRICRNALFACFATLIAAALGGSALAQTVNLSCSGELRLFEPPGPLQSNIDPTASTVDQKTVIAGATKVQIAGASRASLLAGVTLMRVQYA